MYDIIIIGAGPAGLTSALYALRANKSVLIIEAKNYGGQIVNANLVENYPGIKSISGYDFATNLYEQVKNLGGIFRFETVLHVSEDKTVITDHENTYQGKAIIIATGVENRKLKLKNEQEFVGKGVSYCATCDGNFYKEKVVAVNGGGNTAFVDAIYLSSIAKKVYLIHRSETFKAENYYMKELKRKDNVEFLLNATVDSLEGTDKLTALQIQKQDGTKTKIDVDALFIAIGQEPNNGIFSNVVDINEYGYIVAKDEVYTKTNGIYVAGDTRVKALRQLTTAVSDGSLAATMAIRDMNSETK